MRKSTFKGLSAAVMAASFAAGTAATARAGVNVEINLGAPPIPAPVVVMDYDAYYVGPRAKLYDSDWRLRNAQIDEFHAQEALDAARHHEGDLAVDVEDQEGVVAQFDRKVRESDLALAAARAAAGKAADEAADAHARQGAFEKRARAAREDLEAARTLRDADGIADAQKRLHLNEGAAAIAAGDARAAEGRLADLQAAEALAASLNDARTRLAESQRRLPRLREDLAAAHDEVFAARQRLDGAVASVAMALHDRDEALWVLHRDEIFAGRSSFDGSGFHVDFGVWGGRRPADIEVLHAYYVHPVAYWVERPAEIQLRVIEVDRLPEVSRVRLIQEKHEVRFAEVRHFEMAVPIERRRASFEHVAIERQRFVAERTERAAAASEHRAPRIAEADRAEARAIATQSRAGARATQIEARADAKATVTAARADARSEQIKSNANAKSEEIKARADAKSEVTAARADAKSEVTAARADAKSEKTTARADGKAEEIKAKADARSEETKARSDSKAEQAQARGSSRSSASSDRTSSGSSRSSSSYSDSRSSSSSASSRNPRDSRSGGSSTSSNQNSRKKSRDDQAAVDPNSR